MAEIFDNTQFQTTIYILMSGPSSQLYMSLPMKLGHGSSLAANHSISNLEEIATLNACKLASTDISSFSTSSEAATASLILTSLQYTRVSARADYLSKSCHSIYSASRQHSLRSITNRLFDYHSALVFVGKQPYFGVLTLKARTSHWTK